MKSKVVLVAFLLMLYIAPMILISSYASPAILAEPNINKAFSLSTEYEISDESITSFAETLPDDVLYYPDNETHGSGYAHDFTDVSDWEISEGNTITTDGDVGTFTTEGDNAYNIYYCNTPSQSFENYYLEFRYSVNDTDFDKLGISLKSEDS